MNTKRIMAGGSLAGAVIVIGNVVRQTVLAVGTSATGGSMPVGVFILRGASLGIVCVLLYAAARPGLGAGLKTALTIGFLVFLVGTLFPPFGLTMQTFSPSQLLLETIIWNAVLLPVATAAGAWLYREAASLRDPAQLVLGDPLR